MMVYNPLTPDHPPHECKPNLLLGVIITLLTLIPHSVTAGSRPLTLRAKRAMNILTFFLLPDYPPHVRRATVVYKRVSILLSLASLAVVMVCNPLTPDHPPHECKPNLLLGVIITLLTLIPHSVTAGSRPLTLRAKRAMNILTFFLLPDYPPHVRRATVVYKRVSILLSLASLAVVMVCNPLGSWRSVLGGSCWNSSLGCLTGLGCWWE